MGQKLPPVNGKNDLVISAELQSRPLSSKWNKEAMKSSAGLNQKPSDMRYRASIISYPHCTICWSGNRLDRSIRSNCMIRVVYVKLLVLPLKNYSVPGNDTKNLLARCLCR